MIAKQTCLRRQREEQLDWALMQMELPLASTAVMDTAEGEMVSMEGGFEVDMRNADRHGAHLRRGSHPKNGPPIGMMLTIVIETGPREVGPAPLEGQTWTLIFQAMGGKIGHEKIGHGMIGHARIDLERKEGVPTAMMVLDGMIEIDEREVGADHRCMIETEIEIESATCIDDRPCLF